MELAAYAKLAEEIRLDGREKVFPKQIVTLTTLIEKKTYFSVRKERLMREIERNDESFERTKVSPENYGKNSYRGLCEYLRPSKLMDDSLKFCCHIWLI